MVSLFHQKKCNLLDLDVQDCERFVMSLGYKPFHGRNLFKWIHKHGVQDFSQMTDLSKALREKLAQVAEIRIPPIVQEQPAPDGTKKWVLGLWDGQRVETVFIPDGRRTTVCLSTQVGCALNCSFCATARQGFNRNLTVGEIVAQVWHAQRRIGKPPSNLVLMGMGEPLANFENVVKALGILQDDLAYMVSKFRLTLSTSGIVPAIYQLRTRSDVSLAVSLHAPNDALRNTLVPINRKYPLRELIPACRAYIAGDKRRRITWEYVMIRGVNDRIQHAKELIRLLEGTPSKVNLIPFNPFPGSPFSPTPEAEIEAFRKRLLAAGFFATVRKTRGEEIAAACGQLVGRVQDRTRRSQFGVSL